MKKISLFGLFMLILLVAACKKKDTPSSTKPPETVDIDAIFKKLAPATQVFTISPKIGANFTASQGTHFRFPPLCFMDANMQVITDPVEVRLVEVYKKSDMIFTQMPTNDIDDRVLISGGMLNISFFAGNTEVYPRPEMKFQADMPTKKLTDSLPMYVWKFSTDSSDYGWFRDNAPGNRVSQSKDSMIFSMFSSGYNWINCDHYSGYTNIVNQNIELNGLTGSELSVQLYVLSEEKSMIKPYISTDGKATLKGYPSGWPVKLIGVAATKDKIYLGIQPFSINANSTAKIEMKECSEADFAYKIRQLD